MFVCLLTFQYISCVCLCWLDVSVWKLMQVIIHFMLHSHWIMSQTVALCMFTFCKCTVWVCVYMRRSVCVCQCLHARMCVCVCVCERTFIIHEHCLWMNSAPQSTMKRWAAAWRDNAAVFIKYTHTIYTYRLGVKAKIINILSHARILWHYWHSMRTLYF